VLGVDTLNNKISGGLMAIPNNESPKALGLGLGNVDSTLAMHHRLQAPGRPNSAGFSGNHEVAGFG